MTDYKIDSEGHKGREQSKATESKASTLGGTSPVIKKGSIFRLVKIAILIFVIAVAGIGALAYFSGDRTSLPFEYEGFD